MTNFPEMVIKFSVIQREVVHIESKRCASFVKMMRQTFKIVSIVFGPLNLEGLKPPTGQN